MFPSCAVCEHCRSPVYAQEQVAVREGFSYHKKCYKCYVCSETNLHNAEIFKGVIFCSSCAKRIFQGCTSARKTKQQVNSRLKNSRSKTRSYAHQLLKEYPSVKKTKQRDSSKRSRSKLRRKRERSKLQERRLERNFNCVIERAQMGGSTSESVRSKDTKTTVVAKKPAVITEMLQVEKSASYSIQPSTYLKKESVEIGVTTDVTQQLLEQINDFMTPTGRPAHPSPKRNVSPAAPSKKNEVPESQRTRRKRNKSPKPPRPRKTSKPVCSDLRMAELGVSTEIANMALRKKSEMPVIIKSDHQFKDMVPYSLSVLDQESDATCQESMDSAYSTLSDSVKPNCLDRRLRSILKIPYKLFKRNILNRSSLISVLMTTKHGDKMTLTERLKMIFYEEIADHRGRGMRRLYSTINRRKTPYKLGWMDFVANVSKTMPSGNYVAGSSKLRRCKDLDSHSYRCMRAQVMRLAGPTNSHLNHKVQTVLWTELMGKKLPVVLPTELLNRTGGNCFPICSVDRTNGKKFTRSSANRTTQQNRLAGFRKKLKGAALNKVIRNIAKFFVAPAEETVAEEQSKDYDLQTVFQADKVKPTSPWTGMGKTYVHLYSMLA